MTAHLKPSTRSQAENLKQASYCSQLGATLIELILTIVIISIALSGIISVVNITTEHSADPMVQHQAIAIAESYLDEIMLLPVTDPDGINSGETRATFDNILDYNTLNDVGAKNQLGIAIAGLDLYTINISVQSITVSGIDMTQVKIDVSRPGTDTISLSGLKAN